MLKNNKGITLIALVITIIVLLILAGVSIAMLTGENGILTQAQKADDHTAMAEAADKINMALNGEFTNLLADDELTGTSPQNIANNNGITYSPTKKDDETSFNITVESDLTPTDGGAILTISSNDYPGISGHIEYVPATEANTVTNTAATEETYKIVRAKYPTES